MLLVLLLTRSRITHNNINNSVQHNQDVSPESCKQLQLERYSHSLLHFEQLVWNMLQKRLHYLGVHSFKM